MWYNPTEMPLRFGLWTVTNGVLPVPMLVIYWGLGHAGTATLAPWQLIFLFLGLISAATGVVLVSQLPTAMVSRLGVTSVDAVLSSSSSFQTIPP